MLVSSNKAALFAKPLVFAALRWILFAGVVGGI
jgi:hypothetical protein